MKDRIKKIRKELDLTQQKIADRLGVQRNTIAMYEMGKTVPSEAIILSICREFNVNENWLRTGNGEMFRSVNRRNAITKFMEQLLLDESDSFKNRLISVLADLDVTEWEFLEHRMNQLFGKAVEEKFKNNRHEEPPTEASASPDRAADFSSLTIDDKVALYRQELEREEKAAAKSEVS